MVKVFYNLIKAGRKTIEDVSVNLREQVQALIDADNQITEPTQTTQ